MRVLQGIDRIHALITRAHKLHLFLHRCLNAAVRGRSHQLYSIKPLLTFYFHLELGDVMIGD